MVQCLDFADQRHYVVILCLKCNGTLDRKITRANKERLVQRGLGLDEKAAKKVKKTLQDLKLIDKNWNPKGWEKRQFESDHSTRRVRKSRKNKETGNVSETAHETLHDRYGNAPDTEQNRNRTENENARARATHTRRSNKPPDDWQPDIDALIRTGKARPPDGVDVNLELVNFRNHTFASAKPLDAWDGEFAKWLNRATAGTLARRPAAHDDASVREQTPGTRHAARGRRATPA